MCLRCDRSTSSKSAHRLPFLDPRVAEDPHPYHITDSNIQKFRPAETVLASAGVEYCLIGAVPGLSYLGETSIQVEIFCRNESFVEVVYLFKSSSAHEHEF